MNKTATKSTYTKKDRETDENAAINSTNRNLPHSLEVVNQLIIGKRYDRAKSALNDLKKELRSLNQTVERLAQK